MEDNLYLIGEFASINKVSTRMLRHYDKIGLLKPSAIKENGYRYYSEQQISLIAKIKMLRDCDFSLNEIAQILMNDSDVFFREQIEHKIIDLTKQARRHQKAIDLLKGLGNGDKQTYFVGLYGVSLTSRVESTLLVSKEASDLEHIEIAFDKLFVLLGKKHLTINGCVVLLNCFDESDENQNKVGIPVIEAYQDEQYHTIVLPSTTRLSTIHYGDYYNIGYAYSNIMRYAEKNGYYTQNWFTERYFIDCSHTADPNQYVTEISVSVKNNP